MAARQPRSEGRVMPFGEHMLMTVAEELKLPLLQIARQSELAALGQPAATLSDIRVTAEAAIALMDAYLLGARLANEDQYQLALEPVSVSSVLYDVGQQLDGLAKLYGVELELSLGGKFGPVLANRQGLQSALVSLGTSLIPALPNLGGRQQLQLTAHRCRYGIVTGVYSEAEQLTVDALRQGRELQGQARQALVGLTHNSGAGIFVADAIFQAMHSVLQPSRYRNHHGLAAILQPNPQLQLV